MLFEQTVLILILAIKEIYSHGRLIDPPARSTAWRYDSRFPAYYDDTAMYCGGFGVQQQNGGKCGICGENYALPKQFEKGGSLYKGYIVKSYKQGQNISVIVEITANHNGYFEFMICNVDGLNKDATQECLNKIYLKDTNSQTKIYIPKAYNGKINTILKLPDNFSCNHCVFQWRYTAGNSWGIDPTTGQGCLGCGPQEQFFGCSDISISSSSSESTTELTSISSRTTTISTLSKDSSITSSSASSKYTTSLTTSSSTTSLFTTSSTTTPFTIFPKTIYTTKVSPTLASSTTSKASTISSTTNSLTSKFLATTLQVLTEEIVETTTLNPNLNIKCPNGDGFYPNTGCKSFYRCVYTGSPFKQVYNFDCPSGLLFDSTIQVCNWPYNVRCTV